MPRLLLLRDSFRNGNLSNETYAQNVSIREVTQLAFTCSKSKIETLEKSETCSKLIKNQSDPGVFIVNF